MIDPAPTRRTTARTRRRAAVLTGALATTLLPIAFGGSTTAGAAGATSKYVSIAPKRVVDSRDTIDLNRAAPLTANVPTDITLAGIGVPGQANVVPATATAVVATFTVVGATNDGWLQVLPKGQTPAEATSTLNVKAGNDVASTVFIALGTEGKVTLTATFGAEILVDIAGYFTTASTSTDGRFVPLEKPTRLIDTRGAGYLAPADIAPTGSTTPTTPTTVAPTTTAAATTTTVAATTTTVAGTTTTVPGPTTTVVPPATTVQAPSNVPAADTVRVLVAGDSISVGNPENMNDVWRRHAVESLAADKCNVDFVGPFNNGATWDDEHMASNGIQAGEVAEYIGGNIWTYDADVVVIELGTNDAQLGQSTASSLIDLKANVDDARNGNPNVEIILVAPYNLDIQRALDFGYSPGPGPSTNILMQDLRNHLPWFVQNNSTSASPITLVDASSVIGSGDLRDGVHPTSGGDAKLANLILPRLKTWSNCNTHVATNTNPPAAPAATTAAGAPQNYTNTSGSAGKVATPKQAGTTFTVPVAGRVGVPTTGVGSVVLSLTATNVTSAGYLQVSNGTAGANDYSSLNVGVGDTRANLVVVPLSAGNASIFTTATADVIVDVVGYFTDSTNADGATGLFVPATPTRQYDSRTFSPDPATKTIALSTEATGKSAAIVNLTSTANTGGAWVQVGPTPVAAGAHSNLNVPADNTDIAVGAISKIGTNRSIDVHYEAGTTEIIVDVMGWFS